MDILYLDNISQLDTPLKRFGRGKNIKNNGDNKKS